MEKDKKVEEVLRLVGGYTAVLMAEVLQYWIIDWKEEKSQRELDRVTAERKEQMANERKKKMAAMEKGFGASAATLLGITFGGWQSALDAAKLAKARKESGNAVAMKAILGSQEALQMQVLQSWSRDIR